MTRLDNVCCFVIAEIEREFNVKLTMVEGLSSLNCQVIFPNDSKPYNFNYPIDKMTSLGPDYLTNEFSEGIQTEWCRRLRHECG